MHKQFAILVFSSKYTLMIVIMVEALGRNGRNIHVKTNPYLFTLDKNRFGLIVIVSVIVTGYRLGTSYTCAALRDKLAFIATW